MNEEILKIAVFIDFDNIQIGVRSTLSRDFDLGLVLEALKERGEVVTKVAYGNWKRAGELTRTLTQNAVLMVQRDLTPRGDKNGADINLALDALEMAINHPHINAFVVVGGDSDFIALVEKLKTYNKAVFVVGGRAFTSSVLQRNCREFIAYENLVEAVMPERRRDEGGPRRRDVYPVSRAVPLVYRGLKMLNDREVQPQLGLLKSTLIQLDSTFNERDYGASSFRAFIQKLSDAGLLSLRQQGNSYVVEPLEREPTVAPEPADHAAESAEGGERMERNERESAPPPPEGGDGGGEPPAVRAESAGEAPPEGGDSRPDYRNDYRDDYRGGYRGGESRTPPPQLGTQDEAVELLRRVLEPLRGTNPRPLYLRNVKQLLRAEQNNFDEQQYGFASLVDLLRAGQNLNWLRLQRDRRGALRVFIPNFGSGVTPAPGAARPGQPEGGPAELVASEEMAGEGPEPFNRAEQPDPFNRAEPASVVAPPPREPVEAEDSQIAVLGYYDGIHGEQNEEPPLSLAAAVAGNPRKKRTPRKPRPEGGGGSAPRRPRKPRK